jgi:hypothetical protein
VDSFVALVQWLGMPAERFMRGGTTDEASRRERVHNAELLLCRQHHVTGGCRRDGPKEGHPRTLGPQAVMVIPNLPYGRTNSSKADLWMSRAGVHKTADGTHAIIRPSVSWHRSDHEG